MEANMQVLEGAQYRLRVKLTNEAGKQLPPELFRVYAGAFCPGYAPAHFHAERTAEEWVLTMPGLKPGRVPWNWQVIAAEYATGVEWLLAAGEVTVTPRHATGSGCVDPGELKIVATLDKTTLQMTVQVGESTAACSLAVVAAQNSAKEADTSAKAAAGSATDAARSAQRAEEKATEAGEQATAAGKAAQTAGEKATEAGEQATAAGKAAQTAGEKAKEAGEHAEDAAKSAQDASRSQVSATAAKADADAAKLAAQNSERNAKASEDAAAADKADAEQAKNDALAAQGKAEQEAQKAADNAALLGDAALKTADNVFSGMNSFSGDVAADGTICGWRVPSLAFLSEVSKTIHLDPMKWLEIFAPDPEKVTVWPMFDGSSVLYPYPSSEWINWTKSTQCNIRRAFEKTVVSRGYAIDATLLFKYAPLDEATLVIAGAGNPSGAWWINYKNCKRLNVFIPEATYSKSATNPGKFEMYLEKTAELVLFIPLFEYLEINTFSGTKVSIYGSNSFVSVNIGVNGGVKRLATIKNPVFPKATLVNIPASVLDKETVLALVAGLQTYDSATMTEVPTLTLGIDPALDGDEEINAALLNAQAAVEDGGKGWNVAVNGFTITAGGAATMGLRKPVYARRWRDDEGGWVDADGTRWAVRWGNTVLENWQANEQLGYDEFATLDDALEQWGLMEYLPEEAIDD